MGCGEAMTTATFFFAILEFFTSTVLLFFLLFFTTYILWKKKKMLLKLWISLLGTGIVTLLLKFLVQRPRPLVSEYFFWNIPDYSFPSLHTALAFAMIPFFWSTSSRLRWFFLFLSCIIAITRVYFQQHYISDVIGGAFIGLFIGFIILNKYHEK